MTRVVFFREGNKLKGFSISGHCTAGPEDEEGRLCCAAVSSAAYMAANTVTDIELCKADITVKDGEMTLRLADTATEGCQTVLKGFKLHITELVKQYNGYLTTKTEVI